MEKTKRQHILRASIAILLSVATAVAYFPLLGDSIVHAGEQNGDGVVYYAPLGEEGEEGFVAADEAITGTEVKSDIKAKNSAKGASTVDEMEVVEAADVGEMQPAEDLQDGFNAQALSEGGLAYSGPDGIEEVKAAIKTGGEPGPIDEAIDEEQAVDEDTNEIQAMGDGDGGENSEEPDYWIEASVNGSGIATVNAHMGLERAYFTKVCVDSDENVERWINYETDINGLTIDMKKYAVGLHTIQAYFEITITDDNGEDVTYDGLYLFKPGVPTKVFGKPALALSDFYSDYNYFKLYNRNQNAYDSDVKVYINYKRGSGGWSGAYGPLASYSTQTKSGLAATSVYSVRAFYAKSFSYTPPRDINADKDPAAIKGTYYSPYSNVVSFKTGYVKTPVKSIKVKKIKQYCKKYKVRRLSSRVYYRYGYAGWGYYRKVLGTKTYKYWYTKVKVTVKMKKKPGVAGIYIGSKHVKGNKKTYTAKFTLSGKKKGKKIKVSVYSYMNPTYGGWSGKVLKKVKVK